jgi:hypothetical protein
MSEVLGKVARVALAAAWLVAGAAATASAQQPLADAPAGAEFFPRFDFTMSAAALSYPDDRFSWDTHWAGDLDLFDYKGGRAQFLADYQALLGSEFRPFDPYQSNYTLEATGSYFVGRTEIAGVLNHISRHLGDRPKRLAVAENSLGVRVMRQLTDGPNTLDVRGDVRKVIARAFVDYTWMADLDLVLRRTLTPHVGVFGHLDGQAIGVDPAIAGRDGQRGGRLEAGVRLTGTRGAVELFGGLERMIDADPLDRIGRRWAFFGFRLLPQ